MAVFYTKYRPQTVEDLDSNLAREKLKKILSQKKIPQGFLFAGPKGIGKTSSARIFAKAINCLKPKGIEPCNQCQLCEETNKGRNLDVIEIDAASNRGIDDIRSLKEKIALAPVKAKYKVYIIDEVHMLTKEAFNALLKTLEEPPPHVIFILCTTDPEKIIPTVLSRLTRIDFNRATGEEIRRCLKRVAQEEKLKVSEESLDLVAKVADGSFRDAHKILEQLVIECGQSVDFEACQLSLGRISRSLPQNLLNLIIERKTKEAIGIIEEINDRGVNWESYLKELMELLMGKILAGLDKKGAHQRELKLMELLMKVASEQRFTLLPQLPLQIAVIEFIGEDRSLPPEELKSKAGDLPPKQPKVQIKKEPETKEEKRASATKIDAKTVSDKWAEILASVKPMNHSVEAFLKAARPAKVDDSGLVIEVFYKFHKEKLEQPKNKQIIEAALEKIFGKSLNIRCCLGERGELPQKTAVSKPPESDGVTAKAGEGEEDLYEIAKQIFGK